jgi:zinc protease
MASSLQTITVKGKEIPFIFEESKQLPIVSLHLLFSNRGQIADGNLSGLSNLSSSILNEGTLEKGTGFSELLEEKAIQLSANSREETFYISLDSIKESFGRGTELLIELLNSPNLSKETLERVKRKIIGGILQRKSNFDFVANSKLQATIFKDTPFAVSKSGTEESLEKIELSDVENFLKETLTLSNVTPLIGGDLNLSEAKDILKNILENLEIGETPKLVDEVAFSKERKDQLIQKETKQAYIYFASPLNLKYNDEENYKMRVASFILGSSGFGSRLMEEVRVKRGYAYSVSSSFKTTKTKSIFHGHLQTKIENLEEAKKVVVELIADFVEKGATSEELESARKFILGSEPLRNETLSQRIWRTHNNYYKGFELDYHEKELEKIENLTLEELNSFIKKHAEILDFTFSILTLEKKD